MTSKDPRPVELQKGSLHLLLDEARLSQHVPSSFCEKSVAAELEHRTKILDECILNCDFDNPILRKSITSPRFTFENTISPPTHTFEEYIGFCKRVLTGAFPRFDHKLVEYVTPNVDVKAGRAEVMIFAEINGYPENWALQRVTVYKWTRRHGGWLCSGVTSLKLPLADGANMAEGFSASQSEGTVSDASSDEEALYWKMQGTPQDSSTSTSTPNSGVS